MMTPAALQIDQRNQARNAKFTEDPRRSVFAEDSYSKPCGRRFLTVISSSNRQTISLAMAIQTPAVTRRND
jgi:hypothetical protein